jgi:long-chain fatty acid transport protein
MKQCLLALTFFLLFALTETSTAGGFQVNLQGEKQAGMGHAGTGTILDGSSIFFNPGGLCLLDTLFSFNLNVHFIMPRTVYLENAPGVYKAEMVHNTDTPFSLYLALKTKHHSRLSYGLGMYTPFGSKAQWDDDWKGQFLIREIDLTAVFVQPTLSLRITDKLGIGAGFIFATGNFGLRKAIPIQDQNGNYGQASLQGNAQGFGYNGGIFFKATDKLSLGLNYRSAVNMAITGGQATFTVPASVAQYFPQTTFSSNLALPSVITLGAGYSWKKFLFAVDVNYTGWSTFDTLRINFAAHTQDLQNIHSARMYHNSFTFRTGVQYVVNSELTARLGAYYDMSPVSAGYVTPDTPDTDKLGFTAGASLKAGKHTRLDMSMIYIEGLKRTDTNLETQFAGTYKTRAVIPGIGLEVLF